MKILKSSKTLFVFYLLLFFVINILQSIYTELIDDEAYYWLWSQKLSWGYFDHPPMVALWIKISHLFFDGELGVRFFSALMFGATVALLWKLISHKKKNQHIHLFFLLITAVILFNFYGFITVPDTPLFFFTALFLFAYKHFLEHQNLNWSLLLGLAMAGMLYSKYHGVLVIFFVILSNLKLLKNRYFWIACTVGFILFLPHLIWQYNNGYPSIVYHLNRSKKLYQFKFTLLHFLNQLIIVGLAFPVLYYAFFKSHFKEKFNRALLFILIGFISFFFLATFKTSTQPQWTAVILIPLIVVCFPYLITHKKIRKVFVVLASINLLVLLYMRLDLADENLAVFKWETHENKSWAESLQKNTESLPIVFENSFQNASKYTFYTGIETYSYNSLSYRQNQFDLQGYEEKLQGLSVYEVSNSKHGKILSKRRKKVFYGTKITNYRSHQQLKCVINKSEIDFTNKKYYTLEFDLINPYNTKIDLNRIEFYGVFQTKKHKITAQESLKNIRILGAGESQFILPNKTYKMTCLLIIPDKINPLTTTFRVALSFNNLPPGFEGNPVKIIF